MCGCFFWKCNFPSSPSVRRRSVCQCKRSGIYFLYIRTLFFVSAFFVCAKILHISVSKSFQVLRREYIKEKKENTLSTKKKVRFKKKKKRKHSIDQEKKVRKQDRFFSLINFHLCLSVCLFVCLSTINLYS